MRDNKHGNNKPGKGGEKKKKGTEQISLTSTADRTGRWSSWRNRTMLDAVEYITRIWGCERRRSVEDMEVEGGRNAKKANGPFACLAAAAAAGSGRREH